MEDLESLNLTPAYIHGAITSLSPVKKGRNSQFFDGTIADETSQVRIVGFTVQQQKKLNSFYQNKKLVNFVDCEVKPSRQGGKFEVMLNTQVVESKKKIGFSNIVLEVPDAPPVFEVRDLQSHDVFDRVTVNVKVISAKEPNTVADKRNFTRTDDK